jgi:hypothetical protein
MVSFGRLLLKNITATSCILVKTTVSARFDERARFTEDHELWLRIAHQHKIAFLDLKLTTLGREQLSAGGLSGNRLRMRQGELSMYCKVLKYEKRILFFMPFLFLFSLIKHIRKTIQLRFA